jgi:acyl-CoA thioesterase-1
MSNTSGYHDRRFFGPLLKLNLLSLVVSLIFLFFYNWKWGLAWFLAAAISFITMEAVSSPPANRIEVFKEWERRQPNRAPVLACLGDSLTHGNCSASITPEIPRALSRKLGLDPPKSRRLFSDPLWVLNAGQNGITSQTILQERLSPTLSCRPDYVMIWIGTNDVRAIYSKAMEMEVTIVNGLDQPPTMRLLSQNIKQILNFTRQASPMCHIGVFTLPPMGEDLHSNANKLVQEANSLIKQAAAEMADERVLVIDVYQRLEAILEKQRRGFHWSVDWFYLFAPLMNPLFHMCGISWNTLSKLTGSSCLFDGLHLNEQAATEVVDATVEWLLKSNVAKAIAVKTLY